MSTFKASCIIIGLLIGGLISYWLGFVDDQAMVRELWHANIVVLICYITTGKERDLLKKIS